YRAGRLVKLCEFFNSPGFCDEYTHLYCALDLEPLAEAHAVTAEEAAMTVEEVAFAEVDAMIERREIVDAKTIIGLTQTRHYLEGAASPRG
ncbi:MAG: NUDIX hydrolase, partial [Acidimicrobiia bacterium]|nr:NUDIX hydrolase [Acidimicrobiia bacterium]